MAAKISERLKDGDQCEVIKGIHAGKSGVVKDVETSKTGSVSITVIPTTGVRFRTLAQNVILVKKDL